MKHIKLSQTHRLLFRISLGTAAAGLVIGLGILFAPDVFFGSYNVIKQTAPILFWGSLWTGFSSTVLLGLWKFGYRLVRVGMAGLSTLFFTWAIGVLTNQIFNVAPYALIGVFIYLLLAYISASTLLEPPINANTAIRVTEDEK